MGIFCCLQTCNSVENMVVMGLVLGQSLMVKCRAVGDGASGAALAAPRLRDDKVRMREDYDTPLLCTPI